MLGTGGMSVYSGRLFVCLSVCHTLLLTQDHAAFTTGSPPETSLLRPTVVPGEHMLTLRGLQTRLRWVKTTTNAIFDQQNEQIFVAQKRQAYSYHARLTESLNWY